VVKEAPPPPDADTFAEGYVNLVASHWSDELGESSTAMNDEEGVAIEGCTSYDVGFMRVSFQDVMVGMYERLMGEVDI